jgi:hypothetical protein
VRACVRVQRVASGCCCSLTCARTVTISAHPCPVTRVVRWCCGLLEVNTTHAARRRHRVCRGACVWLGSACSVGVLLFPDLCTYANYSASAGNRTRVTSMATTYSTTRPLMRARRTSKMYGEGRLYTGNIPSVRNRVQQALCGTLTTIEQEQFPSKPLLTCARTLAIRTRPCQVASVVCCSCGLVQVNTVHAARGRTCCCRGACVCLGARCCRVVCV